MFIMGMIVNVVIVGLIEIEVVVNCGLEVV